MQQTLVVEDPYQMIIQQFLLFLFVSVLTPWTLGKMPWKMILCGDVVPINTRRNKPLIPTEIPNPNPKDFKKKRQKFLTGIGGEW